MPIQPVYSWEEDDRSVRVTVALRGHKVSDVDVFVGEFVLKVNFSPYLLLLDLCGPVDDTTTTARAKNGSLIVTMTKKDKGQWGHLATQEEDKQAIKERRERSIDQKLKHERELKEKKKSKRHADEKLALRKQMDLEQQERQTLEDLKQAEKAQAEAEMYQALDKLRATQAPLEKRSIHPLKVLETKKPEVLEVAPDGSFDASGSLLPNWVSRPTEQIFEDDSIDSASDEDEDEETTKVTSKTSPESVEETEVDEDIHYIPAPRKAAATKITFTPRIFPTPKRESKAAEEEDWIAKNHGHLSKHKTLAKNRGGDISDTDPTWLKGKGDDFYKSGDFRGAISAYSSALEADPAFIACYSNRAACYLQLDDLDRCIADCTKALCLLPELGESRSSPDSMAGREEFKAQQTRLRVLVRRGTAYCQSGRYSDAKGDYALACALDSNSPALAQDYKYLCILEQCFLLKTKGDEKYADSRVEEAIELYNQGLALIPSFVPCLSNRAACYLVLGEAEKCIQDCTVSLSELQATVQQQGGIRFLQSGALPPPNSSRRKAWVMKTLVRRGTAYSQLGVLDKALEDLNEALKLEPENAEIQASIQRVQSVSDAA